MVRVIWLAQWRIWWWLYQISGDLKVRYKRWRKKEQQMLGKRLWRERESGLSGCHLIIIVFASVIVSTMERKHPCTMCVCDKSFQNASCLSRHLLTHSGERSHKCAQCDKSFGQASHLKRHILTHSGVKMHKCAQCNKSFGQAFDLKAHMLSHTGEKPHKCTQCNYSTTTGQALNFHIRTHTGEKPHQCNHCEYSSSTSSSMKRHKMRKHLNRSNSRIINPANNL